MRPATNNVFPAKSLGKTEVCNHIRMHALVRQSLLWILLEVPDWATGLH